MASVIMMTLLGLVVLTVRETEGFIGRTCLSNSSCSSDKDHLITRREVVEYCSDGICMCAPHVELRYRNNLEPQCHEFFYSLLMLSDGCKLGDPLSCSQNEECVKSVNAFSGFLKEEQCRCKQGYIRVGSDCREAHHQQLLESCHTPYSGPVFSCDLNKKSFCKSGKCICFESFYANMDSGRCEPMSSYIHNYSLEEYRVRPGEYCTEDQHCIYGLHCREFLCSCPEECPYREEEEICDCGPSPTADKYGPAFVGLFLGLIVLSCWFMKIRKTIKTFKKKRNGAFDDLETVPQDSAAGNNYDLSPVDSVANNATNPSSALVVPTSSEDGKHSPLPFPGESTKSLPTQYEGDFPNPSPKIPQSFPFGISVPQPSYSEKPVDNTLGPYFDNSPSVEASAPSISSEGALSAPSSYNFSPTFLSSNSAGPTTSANPYPLNPAYNPSETNSSLPYPIQPYGVTPEIKPGQEKDEPPPPYNFLYP
ncbi:hypothetical protein SK128_023595 [Halocaridina rubra]|uniref:EB domain-containing protein n=1 Tax=Halocaridina rubra TaxID=373956 RepID=A0AAN8XBZ8_HALRR